MGGRGVFNKKDTGDWKREDKEAKQVDKFMSDISITEMDVIKAISEFKEHKAPGVEGITSTYALKIKEMLAKPLR